MPRRKLNEFDIKLITGCHPHLLAEEIAEKLPPGVGAKTVQDYIDEHLQETEPEPATPPKDQKIAPSKKPKHEPKGHAVSTEGDSAIADARRVHMLQEATKGQKERMKEYVHIPFDE